MGADCSVKPLKYNVLFVCLGNICRSPSAEAVFCSKIKDAGLCSEVSCDSAGIIGMHSGQPADSRMRSHASKRGFRLDSISRKVVPEVDFDMFDLIVAMDDANVHDLKQLTRKPEHLAKIRKMTDFSTISGYYEVPDPYYGGSEGFELVLDLLEDACDGLISFVRKQL